MKHNIDPDKILKNIPVPGVESGHHKPKLKFSLIERMSAPSGREVRRNLTTKKALILALIILILSATAVLAYNKYRQIEVKVTCNDDGEITTLVTDENGTREYKMQKDPNSKGPIIIKVDENGEPVMQDELSPEIKDAILKGNYTVTEEEGLACDGKTTIKLNHYKIELGDGRIVELKLPGKLEDLIKSEEE